MLHDTKKNTGHQSALHVNEGVQQPEATNPDLISRIKGKRKKPDIKKITDGILAGNRTMLSQAITLIESSNPGHYDKAQKIIEHCIAYSGNSIRIGITGVPGVGKSSFIEALGNIITQENQLAVLAIDPSSERSKGSILGDKTRMEKLSSNPNAFIRPSPSAGSLGGVAQKTRESIILCEAAGFDVIFIETVGVGQSETAVHSMVDFFLLLMLAGAGDELQGIKRGIMEMADAIAITKTDGNNTNNARAARQEYQSALHLFPPAPSGWEPKVLTCSSHKQEGLSDIWKIIQVYTAFTKKNNYFNTKRKQQANYWMHESIKNQLFKNFYGHPAVKAELEKHEQLVLANKLSSFEAARKLLSLFNKQV